MIEEDWVLSSADGKKIFGRSVRSKDSIKTKAIVFVHGLTCDLTDLPYLPAARAFAKKGYDCLLFNLYDWRKGARHLNDCTLNVHAQDFSQVIAKKASAYDSVYAIGHSYGGPAILHAPCRKVKAVSLWDPSYNIADWWPNWTYQKNGMAFFRGSMDILMPEALNREALTLDLNRCRQLARSFKRPLQVLHAGQGILYKYGESYHSHCRAETDYALLAGVDHCFTTDKALRGAVRKTDNWFQKLG